MNTGNVFLWTSNFGSLYWVVAYLLCMISLLHIFQILLGVVAILTVWDRAFLDYWQLSTSSWVGCSIFIFNALCLYMLQLELALKREFGETRNVLHHEVYLISCSCCHNYHFVINFTWFNMFFYAGRICSWEYRSNFLFGLRNMRTGLLLGFLHWVSNLTYILQANTAWCTGTCMWCSQS